VRSPQPKFSPHRIIIQHRTSKTQRQSTYLVRGIQDSVTCATLGAEPVLRSELCGHPRKQKTRYRSKINNHTTSELHTHVMSNENRSPSKTQSVGPMPRSD
jgi:hypothetical protein